MANALLVLMFADEAVVVVVIVALIAVAVRKSQSLLPLRVTDCDRLLVTDCGIDDVEALLP